MIAALLLVSVAATAPIPAPFHGFWAREGGRCTDGLQMEGMLTIEPRRMVHGEEFMTVTGMRRVSKYRIGVDTDNAMNDEAVDNSTTLLTLRNRGLSLVFETTRVNRKLLRETVPETYRRCKQ